MEKEKKYILIVEDEPINTLFLKAVLTPVITDDTEIITVENGLEAVNVCKENQDIHLILMDVRMMVMNGYDATKEIKSFNPHVPIIAQTSFASLDDKVEAIAVGCDDYITKPIDRNLLIEKVSEHIELK